jgi:hypothetical protein
MVEMVTEETKLLGEALSTVKIQVQQMKRHLVCLPFSTITLPLERPRSDVSDCSTGIRLAYGRAQECKPDAR